MESVGGTPPVKPAVYLQDLSVAASTAAASAAVEAEDENAPGTMEPEAAAALKAAAATACCCWWWWCAAALTYGYILAEGDVEDVDEGEEDDGDEVVE